MNKIFTEKAERLNGRLAMIGFVAAVGAYLATGQVIPGVWWILCEKSPPFDNWPPFGEVFLSRALDTRSDVWYYK